MAERAEPRELAGWNVLTSVPLPFDVGSLQSRHSVLSPLLLDGQHIRLAQNDIILAVNLDLSAAVLAVEHRVADVERHLAALAGLFDQLAGAGREHLALHGLLAGVRRQDDAAAGHLFRLERLDDDAVV